MTVTRIVNADEGLAEACGLIKQGRLVVFPTETVYGLGADAFNAAAVAEIFRAKGRPQDNPLIVHISSLAQIDRIAEDVPAAFYKLAAEYMPGPLTVVLRKRPEIPDIVTAGGATVAVRMPADAAARALIDGSAPLAAPSANRSKHVSPTTAQHVYDDLNGRVDLILDGGPCAVGIESTVLDLTSDPPAILRPGAITAEMLAALLGEVCSEGKIIKIAKSPGMKYAHYAPAVETVTAESIDSGIAYYRQKEREGRRPILVIRDIHRHKTEGLNVESLGVTADDYTRKLYAALRRAEKRYDCIIIEELNGAGIAASVMNRVRKAAGGKRV